MFHIPAHKNVEHPAAQFVPRLPTLHLPRKLNNELIDQVEDIDEMEVEDELPRNG